MKTLLRIIVLVGLLFSIVMVPRNSSTQAAVLSEISASDLINLINGMRVAYGLPALNIDPILMSTAQQTSDTMALNDIHAHIGNVSGRVMAAGYGGGATAWATENFAIGHLTIEQIQQVWADSSHMIPVVNANYTDIGAGVTTYNGNTWYIIHAAYFSGGTVVRNTTVPGTSGTAVVPLVSQIIIPVETVEPNEDGSVIHEVQSGQALWSIAIAYGTKIEELIRLNNLSKQDPIIYIGQKIIVFAAKTSPTAPAAQEDPNITPTTTPTEKSTFIPTATHRPTKTPTKIIPTATSTLTATPNPQEVIKAESIKIFGNRTIGMVFISVLALGILLIITGSLGKTKK